MLPSSNALPNTLSASPSLSLPLSHCVLGSLSLPHSYHLFSLLGMGSFYRLKGTLLTTHICPFIILRGLFYSCPSTVADADQCLAMLNRSEKASAGQRMHRGVREAHPCQFCNRKICGGGRASRKRDVKESTVQYTKKRTDGCREKNLVEEIKKKH